MFARRHLPRLLHPCAVSLGLGLAACGPAPAGLDGGGVAAGRAAAPQGAGAAAGARPAFVRCEGHRFAPPRPRGFGSAANARLAALGPRHSAQDIIGNPDGDVHAVGWFTYGRLRRTLSAERIGVALDACAGWQPLGSTVTDAGQAVLPFAPPAVGRFEVVQAVQGDASYVVSRLHVLPQGTHVVLFDIDGTLTVDDAQFIRQMADGRYVPRPWADAARATRAWARKGYVVVYLTGRPVMADAASRAWLQAQNFAPGHLHLAKYGGDVAPTNRGVGAYKRDYIDKLQRQLGLVVDYAYGNAPTDVFAYTQAGLHPEQIFMLGPHAGMAGTGALPRGYREHLPFIAAQPAPEQPFDG